MADDEIMRATEVAMATAWRAAAEELREIADETPPSRSPIAEAWIDGCRSAADSLDAMASEADQALR